jgi:hypothetical protein
MTVAAPSTNRARTTSRPAPPRPNQRPPSALELIRSADSAEEAPPEAGSAPLDRANVREREQGRSRVS